MFQTMTSFVMRIRLGGRGYAPASDCPLMKHSKGLAEFTDLMLKLQTIIEEDVNSELVLFCSLAVLDPRVGHTMDVLSLFIPVLCYSD